jgi:hypothetical protein
MLKKSAGLRHRDCGLHGAHRGREKKAGQVKKRWPDEKAGQVKKAWQVKKACQIEKAGQVKQMPAR